MERFQNTACRQPAIPKYLGHIQVLYAKQVYPIQGEDVSMPDESVVRVIDVSVT